MEQTKVSREEVRHADRDEHFKKEVEVACSYLLHTLGEAADFWEEVRKDQTHVIQGTVVRLPLRMLSLICKVK